MDNLDHLLNAAREAKGCEIDPHILNMHSCDHNHIEQESSFITRYSRADLLEINSFTFTSEAPSAPALQLDVQAEARNSAEFLEGRILTQTAAL